MHWKNIKNKVSSFYKIKVVDSFNKINIVSEIRSLKTSEIVQDFIASTLVFLVALPLSLGIAIASGVPPVYGIITAIIGGFVGGIFSSCPVQITGPAGGLIVISLAIVEKFGFANLGLAVFATGILQMVVGYVGLAPWLQVVSPAIIIGMFAGIGVIIFSNQFLVMLSAVPTKSTIDNLFSIPEVLFKTIFPENESTHHIAASIGLITFLTMIFWQLLPYKKTKLIPATLVAVFFASAVANIIDLPVDFVSIPKHAIDHIRFFELGDSMNLIWNGDFFVAIISLTFIASIQAMLTSQAIGHMTANHNTDYNQEIFTQGIGNSIAGIFNSLPLTGTILRSIVVMNSGGKTRLVSIFQGLWLIITLFALLKLVKLIPLATLAAVLVFISFKLMRVVDFKRIYSKSLSDFIVGITTFLAVILTNIFQGVLWGIILSSVKLLYDLSKFEAITEHVDKNSIEFKLTGSLNFVNLPKFTKILKGIPEKKNVIFNLEHLKYIDYRGFDALINWDKQYRQMGGTVVIEWRNLETVFKHK